MPQALQEEQSLNNEQAPPTSSGTGSVGDEAEDQPLHQLSSGRSSIRGVRPGAPQGTDQVTVETETVPAVPTLAVGTGASAGNSLRIKRSQDSVPRVQRPQKKRSTRLGSSKADYFAAKVANAMDEAHSSDSDETFVYDTNPNDSTSSRRPFLRQHSTQSLLQVSPRNRNPGARGDFARGEFARGDISPTDPQQEMSDSNSGQPRPIRNFVVSRNPPPGRNALRPNYSGRSDSMRARNSYLQRWRSAPGSIDDEDDEDLDYAPSPKAGERTPLRLHRQGEAGYMGGYGRRGMFDEENSPHDFRQAPAKKPSLYVQCVIWSASVFICLLSFALVIGLFMAISQPLSSLDAVSIAEVLPSDKELVCSIILRGQNPGLLNIEISDAELDVFATTMYADSLPLLNQDETRTILLGTVNQLESPVIFPGKLFRTNRDEYSQWASAPIKLLASSGSNASQSQWTSIVNHPFDLTIKGVLKYRLKFGSDIRAALSATTPVNQKIVSLDENE